VPLHRPGILSCRRSCAGAGWPSRSVTGVASAALYVTDQVLRRRVGLTCDRELDHGRVPGTPSIVELLERLAHMEVQIDGLERENAGLRQENAVLRAENADLRGPARAGLVELLETAVG
jgi:hypothetical protein